MKVSVKQVFLNMYIILKDRCATRVGRSLLPYISKMEKVS